MKRFMIIIAVFAAALTANAQGYYHTYTMNYDAYEHENDVKFSVFERNATHNLQFWPGNLSVGIGAGPSKVRMWNPDKDHTGDMLEDVWCMKLGPLDVAWSMDWTVIGDVLGYALYKGYDYSRYGLTVGEMTWGNSRFWTSQSLSFGFVYEHYRWYLADSSGNHIGWTPSLEAYARSYSGEERAYGIQMCYRFGILSFNAEFTTASRSYHVMVVFPFEYFLQDMF